MTIISNKTDFDTRQTATFQLDIVSPWALNDAFLGKIKNTESQDYLSNLRAMVALQRAPFSVLVLIS